MRGLALEGGGARGAYQIGVIKALCESGYEFDGAVGTSIGAINAATLVQGDLDRAVELWKSISMEQLFAEDEVALVMRLSDFKHFKPDLFTGEAPAWRKALKKIIVNKGIDTKKIKNLLSRYIFEEKIRQSGKDFGLVTISISDRKPFELMLPDIPSGQVGNYIMASASFPGFRPESIEEKRFLDGSFYNNCPFNLLLDKGYDEVIAVRTNAHGVVHKTHDERVRQIIPHADLGSLLLFTPENCAENMEIGYNDGLRFISTGAYLFSSQ